MAKTAVAEKDPLENVSMALSKWTVLLSEKSSVVIDGKVELRPFLSTFDSTIDGFLSWLFGEIQKNSFSYLELCIKTLFGLIAGNDILFASFI